MLIIYSEKLGASCLHQKSHLYVMMDVLGHRGEPLARAVCSLFARAPLACAEGRAGGEKVRPGKKWKRCQKSVQISVKKSAQREEQEEGKSDLERLTRKVLTNTSFSNVVAILLLEILLCDH